MKINKAFSKVMKFSFGENVKCMDLFIFLHTVGFPVKTTLFAVDDHSEEQEKDKVRLKSVCQTS